MVPISCFRTAGSDEAGPIVATILVRRGTIGMTLSLSASGLREGVPPGYNARSPSSPSIRSSWLYFAVRSERAGAPVLIWPVPSATARSAIVASSVSPERWDITAV